jgi:hypothetical protein
MVDNATQKTKVRATLTPLKTEVNSGVPEGTAVRSCSSSDTLPVTLGSLLTLSYI